MCKKSDLYYAQAVVGISLVFGAVAVIYIAKTVFNSLSQVDISPNPLSIAKK
jgi:hypothetical protein